MNPAGHNEESCAVCGKAVAEGLCTAHVYHDGRRFPLCCPMCLDLFQRAPGRFARGEHPRTVVEDLIAQMKWHDS
jgi:ribosomal protein L24E